MHGVENVNMYHVSQLITIPWPPGRLSHIYLCNHEIESIKVIYILMEWYNHNQMASEANEGKWALLIGVSHCGSRPHGMDLIPRIAHTYHEVDGNLNLWVGVFPAQPPGAGVPGHPVRAMCPPQGPDLGLSQPRRVCVCVWGGSRDSLSSEGAPYVGSGMRRLPDQPPSGKEDNMPGIAERERERDNTKIDGLKKWQWGIKSRTGVGIHGGKDGLIGGLTERKATDLEGCCFHLLSWPNNQHLSFSSQGWASVPCVFTVRYVNAACVCVRACV